jgi:hypothetical protein
VRGDGKSCQGERVEIWHARCVAGGRVTRSRRACCAAPRGLRSRRASATRTKGERARRARAGACAATAAERGLCAERGASAMRRNSEARTAPGMRTVCSPPPEFMPSTLLPRAARRLSTRLYSRRAAARRRASTAQGKDAEVWSVASTSGLADATTKVCRSLALAMRRERGLRTPSARRSSLRCTRWLPRQDASAALQLQAVPGLNAAHELQREASLAPSARSMRLAYPSRKRSIACRRSSPSCRVACEISTSSRSPSLRPHRQRAARIASAPPRLRLRLRTLSVSEDAASELRAAPRSA